MATITAYLDLRDSLIAHGDEELRTIIDRDYPGDGTVYRLSWQDGQSQREGFVSATCAADARALCRAHELAWGRHPQAIRARKWGTVATLTEWALSRAN